MTKKVKKMRLKHGFSLAVLAAFLTMGAAQAFAQGGSSLAGTVPLPAEITGAGDAGAQNLGIAPPTVGDPLSGDVTGTGAPSDPLAWSPETPAADPAPVAMPPAEDPLATTMSSPPEAQQPVAEAVTPPVVLAVPETQPESEKALESRIAALEQQVAEMEKIIVSKFDFEDLKQTVEGLRNAKAAPEQSAAATPAVPAPAVNAVNDAAAPVKKAAPAAPKWVLKSAKPGMAWLAQPGSRELRAVAVGEKLPGLGKVTEVAQDPSGRWIVTGTHGKVMQ